MNEASCKCDRAFLTYRNFQRFVKPSTGDMPKGFESVQYETKSERSSNDFGRILRMLLDYSNLSSNAFLGLALCIFNNKNCART